MPQGKKTDPTVTAFIEKLLDEDPSLTGPQLHAQLKRAAGGREVISERKVYQIKKNHSPPEKVERAEWHSWDKRQSRPQEINHLLQLDAANMRDAGRHLFQDQVPWANKLRVALEGLPVYDQLWIIKDYARRGRSAVRRDRLPDYSDLDGLLAYKPWKHGNALSYECALITGLVPRPKVFTTPEMAERLETLRRMLGAPEDEAIKASYEELPSYWECVRYQQQSLTPPDSTYSLPASLAKGWPKADWSVNARAAKKVSEFWESGSLPPTQTTRATQRMVIESFKPASAWEEPGGLKEGEVDGR